MCRDDRLTHRHRLKDRGHPGTMDVGPGADRDHLRLTIQVTQLGMRDRRSPTTGLRRDLLRSGSHEFQPGRRELRLYVPYSCQEQVVVAVLVVPDTQNERS